MVITGNLLWIGHNLVFKPSVSLLQATRWTTLDVLKAENVRYVSKYLFWSEEVQVLSPTPSEQLTSVHVDFNICLFSSNYISVIVVALIFSFSSMRTYCPVPVCANSSLITLQLSLSASQHQEVLCQYTVHCTVHRPLHLRQNLPSQPA